jgi:hypothetical protein
MKKQLFTLLLAGTLAPVLAGPMDVTIKGESKDKVEIERVTAFPDVSIKDVIPFSRLGQTDWVLSEELGYLDEEHQVALMKVQSPKTYKPSMINFPKPPFFVQAYPPPPVPIVIDKSPDAPPPAGQTESWTFIVVDQNNRLPYKKESNTVPVDPIQWDGMNKDEFILRTDEIYSSVLIIRETRGVTRQIPGEPIWLPALRYIKGNKIVFEFSNKRVYQEGTTNITPAFQVLVDQLMNELCLYQGSPFSITIYDKDLSLAQKRVGMWKGTLEKKLLIKQDGFNVSASAPRERGDITQVILEITK